MKPLFILLTVFAFYINASAQNAIAKIKYEQAEEAFEKNDYAITLTRLDEAQKLLGASNPKILYLRLMAAKGVIAGRKYTWGFLDSTRKDADYYLKRYSEVEGIEEKFRQVYEFSESLEAFPKTKELFDQKEAQAVQVRNEWLKQRPLQASDSLMNVFSVNECRTMDGFLNSRYSSELKKSKESTKYTTIYERKNNYTGYPQPGLFEIRFNDKGQCVFYSYLVLAKTTDTAMAKNVYRSYADLYPVALDNEWVERKELTRENQLYEQAKLTVKPPATGNKGDFNISYFQYSDGALIIIFFYPQS